jgi:hypothetical protein
MESVDPERMRMKLALGKFRVIRITKAAVGFDFILELPNSVYMTINVPTYADVREGDLLTLYTEVLTHANPEPPSIQ